MSGGNKYANVALKCPKCGNVTHILRKRSRLKEKDHVKHLWCFVCKERTPHVEVREWTID